MPLPFRTFEPDYLELARERLGFEKLRQAQQASFKPILKGRNTLIVAPTASGKTEAAVFPLLQNLMTKKWPPVSVVYVAPLRALLNNLLPRISRYCELAKAKAFLWHGDIEKEAKASFLESPSDALLLTPESLEVLLTMHPRWSASGLGEVKAVVVDEIHAFAGDNRGSQLLSLLERLSHLGAGDFQRVFLSATIGSPRTLLDYLCAASGRRAALVEIPDSTVLPEISVHFCGGVHNQRERTSRFIENKFRDKKALVFCDSRGLVESVGSSLSDLGQRTRVVHSSLPHETRKTAEDALCQNRRGVVVATSSFELGMDAGNLEHVLQVGAPPTVASLRQRMGRAGRREGQEPTFTMLCTSGMSLLKAIGLLDLLKERFYEPCGTPEKNLEVLAQQLICRAKAFDGVPSGDPYDDFRVAPPFSGITKPQFDGLVGHMVSLSILDMNDGTIGLGKKGRTLALGHGPKSVFSVFETPVQFTVLHDNLEIGELDPIFVARKRPGKFRFSLGAKPWLAMDIQWKRRIIHAVPVKGHERSVWRGGQSFWSYKLCQAIRRALVGESEPRDLAPSAMVEFERQKLLHSFLPKSGNVIQRRGARSRLYTFAGGAVNSMLGFILERELELETTPGNLYIGFDESASPVTSIEAKFKELRDQKRPNDVDALRFAEHCSSGFDSKFSFCLNREQKAIHLVERLVDQTTARKVAALPLVVGGSMREVYHG